MKQKFKRLFIIFGVFLVFSLLFTIRTPAHAYTSETMPDGYRLLTSSDVGKTFGVDLESIVYFDTSITDGTTSSFTLNARILSFSDDIYFVTNYVTSGPGSPGGDCQISEGWEMIYYFDTFAFNWYLESYTFTEGVSISSINSTWINNWLYVKDIANVCYTEEDLENARVEGYNEGFNAGVSSVDTQDYYNQGYSAASDDFLVFENLIFGTMNGFTRTIQSLMDFEIFGFSVFGLVGGLVGVAFGIGLIVLIIKVVKIFV